MIEGNAKNKTTFCESSWTCLMSFLVNRLTISLFPNKNLISLVFSNPKSLKNPLKVKKNFELFQTKNSEFTQWKPKILSASAQPLNQKNFIKNLFRHLQCNKTRQQHFRAQFMQLSSKAMNLLLKSSSLSLSQNELFSFFFSS